MENKYNISISKESAIEFNHKLIACLYSDRLNLTETIQELAEFKIEESFDDNFIDKIKNNPNDEYCIKINDHKFDGVKLNIKENKILIYRSWH